jgi:predicted amidohydrolase YtcJ
MKFLSYSLRWFFVSVLSLVLTACANSPKASTSGTLAIPEPATIYVGGTILTMVGDTPEYAEALVVHGGEIAFVGTREDAIAGYANHTLEDLGGQTLLPGFLDGHGHLYNSGFLSLMANLYPPPDGPGQDHDALVASLKSWAETEDGSLVVGKYGWIIGNGYDDSQLAEKDHPTAEVLDRVSTELPVLVIHQSGHLASINNKAIELLGFSSTTPDPAGGAFRRNADGSPNGVLEETAFFSVAFQVLNKTDAPMRAASLARAQEQYAKWGYTTAQDGRSSPNETGALARAAQTGALYLDVVAYPDIQFGIAAMESEYYDPDPVYRGHYRIGGAKLSLDGSPQGKTAWLSKPYFLPPHGQGADYAGYGAMPDEQANALVATAFANNWQLLIHANGDAAIDQMIEALGRARAAHNRADHRTVLIHGQALRKNQIAGLVRNGIFPSLFPMHTYYWGDWHRDSVLGNERAQYISPTRDVLQAGLTLTSHHDAPVTFPNSMRVLDATVNRTTRSGDVLGADQRLTPYEGLKTLTAWAAAQYFEEDRKGTLEPRKLADLVILDHNPLTIDPARIHTIRVIKTIKEGQTVWSSSVAERTQP